MKGAPVTFGELMTSLIIVLVYTAGVFYVGIRYERSDHNNTVADLNNDLHKRNADDNVEFKRNQVENRKVLCAIAAKEGVANLAACLEFK